jgi:hypothetical protein
VLDELGSAAEDYFWLPPVEVRNRGAKHVLVVPYATGAALSNIADGNLLVQFTN